MSTTHSANKDISVSQDHPDLCLSSSYILEGGPVVSQADEVGFLSFESIVKEFADPIRDGHDIGRVLSIKQANERVSTVVSM